MEDDPCSTNYDWELSENSKEIILWWNWLIYKSTYLHDWHKDSHHLMANHIFFILVGARSYTNHVVVFRIFNPLSLVDFYNDVVKNIVVTIWQLLQQWQQQCSTLKCHQKWQKSWQKSSPICPCLYLTLCGYCTYLQLECPSNPKLNDNVVFRNIAIYQWKIELFFCVAW